MADGRASDMNNNPKEGSGYKYTIAWKAIKDAAKTCNWCKLLPKRRGEVEGKAQVLVRYYKDNGYTPVGDKYLTVVVKSLEDGSTYMDEDFLLYTTRGIPSPRPPSLPPIFSFPPFYI